MGFLVPFIGPALQAISGIASGVGGKKAAKKGDKVNDARQAMYQQMGQSNIDTANFMRSQVEAFQNPQMAADIEAQARGLGSELMGYAQDAANRLGQGGFMGDARSALSGAGNFEDFSFDPARTTMEQARALSDQMGQTARTQASDQTALATRQSVEALDAALAGRGFSRNSGAAAAGMSQLQQQNALARSQLEGELAGQAGQLGLQASQFDIQSALGLADMGSRYNLGMNSLRSQTGLGQAQGLMGLQGMQDQQAMARAGLLSGAATQGLDILQNTYSQNYLAPQMGYAQQLGTIGSYQGGYAQSGMDALANQYAAGAAAGGAGMGAQLFGSISNGVRQEGGIDGIMSAIQNKLAGGGGNVTPAVVPYRNARGGAVS